MKYTHSGKRNRKVKPRLEFQASLKHVVNWCLIEKKKYKKIM